MITPYPFPSLSEFVFIHTDIYNALGLFGPKGVVMDENVGLLHLHLLLNCVHKYTDIYEAIDLLVLQGLLVVERGSPSYSSLYPSDFPSEYFATHTSI